ncbi:endonuclease VII domain-containing protein [Streptomyces sp. NPDC029674]|uniref:endonuclease VII domain-containing protein n=1 Tax=Streptomyces sp. NPDC029674 TaxID=3365297 RepID=UPI00384D1086
MGCPNLQWSAGYCTAHYAQIRKGGLKALRALRVSVDNSGVCAVPECAVKARSKGLCNGHYARTQHQKVPDLDSGIRSPRPHDFRFRDGLVHCSKCDGRFPEAEFGRNVKGRLMSYCSMCGDLSAFKMTRKDFDRLLSAQGSKCAICERTQDEAERRFSVDHDHSCCPGAGKSCGKCIRGLLCGPCNLFIGLAGDRAETLMRAAAYIESGGMGRSL